MGQLVGEHGRSTPRVPGTAVGQVDGLLVQLALRGRDGRRQLRVWLQGEPRAAPLRVEPSRPWPRPRRWGRVLTGDLRFDGRVLVSGPPDLVAAVFGHQTRSAVLEWIEAGGTALSTGPGGLVALIAVEVPMTPAIESLLVVRVRGLLAAWPLWAPVADLYARWTSFALTDTDRRVRALNARHYLKSTRLGPEDAVRLDALARGSAIPGSLREEAAMLLARIDGSRDALAKLLFADHPGVVLVAAHGLLQVCPDAAGAVGAALGRVDDTTAVILAERLAQLGHPDATSGLIGLTARVTEQVRVAGLSALGRVGRPAVAPLLADLAGRLQPGPEHRAARAALQMLRVRFPDDPWSGQGAVSLAEKPSGEVSLLDPAGRSPDQ